MLEGILSLMGSYNTVHSFCQNVSGLLRGKKDDSLQYLEKMNRNLEGIHNKFEQLSEHIIYAKSLNAVEDVTRTRQQKIEDLREARQYLEPVQQTLGQEIVSSAIVVTPEKMQQALQKNPWDVLMEVRPASFASKPPDSDSVPILFIHNNVQYIGWQKRGALRVMFDCELNELWLPPTPSLVSPTGTPLTQLTPMSKLKQGEFRDKLKDGTDAPAMVWLPKGKFKMGSNQYSSEKPIHEVTIDYEFAVGKYPVTFAEYDKFCDSTRQKKPEDEGWRRGNRPVIYVNWNDARDYCEWLSEQTGQVYRLLSEAEWEYACRAGSTGKYCFGDDVHQLASYGWFNGNSGGKTQPVGQKKPNQFGLYDMHGNVWEWCEDVWHENYNGAPNDGNAWLVGGDSKLHLLRGGSWGDDDNNLRCAARGRYDATLRNYYGGFRLSRM
jgi:formylglycine-generating enzyme required for sulfatase activity